MKYIANGNINHDGHEYKVGDTIELNEAQAAALGDSISATKETAESIPVVSEGDDQQTLPPAASEATATEPPLDLPTSTLEGQALAPSTQSTPTLPLNQPTPEQIAQALGLNEGSQTSSAGVNAPLN